MHRNSGRILGKFGGRRGSAWRKRAQRGWVRHFLGENPIAYRSRLERRPVGRVRQQALVLGDDLVVEDLDPAFQVVLGLQDGLCRIFARQFAILFPIEIAVVALCVFVGQLQQAFTPHGPATHFVDLCDFRLGMTNASRGIEVGFGSSQRLKEGNSTTPARVQALCKWQYPLCTVEVRPEDALVGVVHVVEVRTKPANAVRHLRGKHFGRDGFLHDLIPRRVPGFPA